MLVAPQRHGEALSNLEFKVEVLVGPGAELGGEACQR